MFSLAIIAIGAIASVDGAWTTEPKDWYATSVNYNYNIWLLGSDGKITNSKLTGITKRDNTKGYQVMQATNTTSSSVYSMLGVNWG
jgi:hypothetical protein